uniref:Uncharacterized protein n=1 Tax=Aegilops tauschii subsp. strangulata TaxID=200361 RepID=A0A453CSH2_AEGTS
AGATAANLRPRPATHPTTSEETNHQTRLSPIPKPAPGFHSDPSSPISV